MSPIMHYVFNTRSTWVPRTSRAVSITLKRWRKRHGCIRGARPWWGEEALPRRLTVTASVMTIGYLESFLAFLCFLLLWHWRQSRNLPIMKWPLLGMLPGFFATCIAYNTTPPSGWNYVPHLSSKALGFPAPTLSSPVILPMSTTCWAQTSLISRRGPTSRRSLVIFWEMAFSLPNRIHGQPKGDWFIQC